MKGIIIRPAKVKDLKHIAKLTQEEFPYLHWKSKDIRHRFDSPLVHYFIARKRNLTKTFIGFIDLEQITLKGWKLEGMAIAPKQRGQGFGSALTNFGVREMKQQGAKEVHLIVKSHNDVARAMYEHRGFVVEGAYQMVMGGDQVIRMVLEV